MENGKTTRRVAVPSMWPGGLESFRSSHFGHCDCFTLVDLDDEGVAQIHVVANVPHQQGGCLAPVQLLQENEANAIIVHGIGMRPLIGFQQAGIQVYQGQGTGVGEAIRAFLAEEIVPMDESQACGGGA
jgi:predicted Fe-Mo cluster-binding NifX family protein